MQRPAYDYLCKCLMFGDGGVGKSSLAIKFADNFFTPSYITSLGVDFRIRTLEVQGYRVKHQIFHEKRLRDFKKDDAAFISFQSFIICYDITDRRSFESAARYVEAIRTSFLLDKSPLASFILVGTKSDKEDRRDVSEEEGRQLAKELDMSAFIECSAKTGKNVNNLFKKSTQLLLDKIDEKRKSEKQKAGKQKTNLPILASKKLEKEPTYTLEAVYEEIDKECKRLRSSFWYFRDGDNKALVLEEMKLRIQEEARYSSVINLKEIIDEFKTDETQLTDGTIKKYGDILHTHRSVFFSSNRNALTNTEVFINKLVSYKLS